MRTHTPVRRVSGALLALGCGALAAGCARADGPAASTSPQAPAVPSAPSVSAPASQAPDKCVRSQLSIDVEQPYGAAGGTSYGDVVLTNVSRTACWVQGSASVVPLDGQRRVVHVALSGPAVPAQRVVLAPGGSASEVLGYGSDGDPAPGQLSCGPEEDYFEVTLPGAAQGVEVPGWHRQKCASDDIVTSNLVSGASARP